MALVTAATGAALASAGLYLNAKFHIYKDYAEWKRTQILTAVYIEAVKRNRQSVYYFFEASALRRGEEECIWSRAGGYTWTQALHRVHQYGHWFLSRGVKPHDYVAIFMINSPDMIFAWLGLWSVGAAPAMINYNLTGAALVHSLRVSGARLMLVDEDEGLRRRVLDVRVELKGKLGVEIVVLNGTMGREIAGCSEERPADVYREGVRGDWPMAMFYTSGTTGMPKGVPYNMDRAFVSGHRIPGFSIVQEDDRWYNSMPLYHGTGGVMSVGMLMQGITLCIGRIFSTRTFWQDIHDSQATWFTYVGETARYLLAAPPSPLDTQHHVRAMYGNGLRPDIWNRFQARFHVAEILEFFNSSEGVFGLVNYCRGPYLQHAVGHHGLLRRFLLRDTYIPVLVDPDTNDLIRSPSTGHAIRAPYTLGGEILVRVPHERAFSGYHNNTKATQQKFVRDVFAPGDLFYRTGDALRRTDDGRWFFLDRLGDTFRWKGENVSTAEVAQVLGGFEGVVEANVYGVEVPEGDGKAGCAAVYIDPRIREEEFDFGGLLRHARAHLPPYAVPLFLRLVRAPSPMHNNKQNKVPLRAQGIDPEKVGGGDGEADRLYWAGRSGTGKSEGNGNRKGAERYVLFRTEEWEDLKAGRASL